MKFEENAALLERTAEQIQHDIMRGIAVQGIHKRGAYDPGVTDHYNNTLEAWGYNVVIEAVFIEQVIVLMRLWDDRDDVLSIPRAKKILSDTEFLDWFIGRERKNPGAYTPDEREGLIRRDLDKFNVAYDDTKGHHTLDHLRNLRNKTLAHNAEDPKRQKATYGYADQLLEKTIPVAEAVNIIARSHGFHGKNFVEAWVTRADNFWTNTIKGMSE